MKVVFEIIGMGAKKYGGFEKYIVEEARQLKGKGYKLIVVFDREPVAKAYVRDLLNLGAEIEVIPQKSKWAFIKQFNHLLNVYKPEIVHTNFSSNIFMAMPLAMCHGIKRRIASEHCLPEADRLKIKVSSQIASVLANYILPVSKKSTEAMKNALWFGKKKIQTLYLGVEDLVFDRNEVRRSIGISDGAVALMNIAYHNPVKGVDVLIDAMNIIVNERGIKDIILYQIGGGQTGTDTEFLHNKVKEYGIENNVVWMGIRNDVPRLLCGGDIYVQPSRSEGCPLSIMEASLASLPVVATNVGGIPEAAINGKNAIIVQPENPEALAEGIITLYKNPELRQQYGQEGRTIALDKFCLNHNVTRLIKDYYHL